MKSRLQCLLIVGLLLQSSGGFAQDDSLDYYFDEGRLGGRNIVKLGLLSIISGDLPVFYDRTITDGFGIEVGAGLLLPYYVTEIPDRFTGADTFINNPSGGYSLWFHPKLYLFDEGPEANYMSLLYRRRSYNTPTGRVIYSDFTFGYGIQAIIVKWLVLDYHAHIGFRFRKLTSNPTFEDVIENMGIVMPLALKLGIIF